MAISANLASYMAFNEVAISDSTVYWCNSDDFSDLDEVLGYQANVTFDFMAAIYYCSNRSGSIDLSNRV